MNMHAAALAASTRKLIESVLRKELQALDPTSISVRPGADHDGDPVLFVEIVYRDDGPAIDPKDFFGLTSTLRAALWEHGEERFPHIRRLFPENQKIVGDR